MTPQQRWAVTRVATADRRGCRSPPSAVARSPRRLRFDLPGQRPERFRIVYRLQPDEQRPDTIEVIAIGPRGGHAAYQAAAKRLNPTDTDP